METIQDVNIDNIHLNFTTASECLKDYVVVYEIILLHKLFQADTGLFRNQNNSSILR